MQRKFLFLTLLFLFSGCSGLIYQVVWIRKLQLSFGVTAFAFSAVLAAYFLGLALGSFFGGKFADRIKRPILAYGLIEIVIGVTAILISPYLDRVDMLLAPFSTLLEDQFWSLQGARFAVTMVVLLIPTTALGITVPLMSRGVITGLSNVGNRMATLYAANTLGAVLGVLVSGFYLIETIGLNATILLAGLVSIVVGGLAIVVQKTLPIRQFEQPGQAIVEPIEQTERQVPESVLLIVMGCSGAMGLALEVVWIRILIQNIGTSAYILATVLAVFLIGIALGSYFVKGRIDKWQNIVGKLAFCEVSIGACTLLVIPVLEWVLPSLTQFLLNVTGVYSTNFVSWVGWCFVTLLPTTLLLGATFPLAARLIANRQETVGEEIGRLYAVNTLGGVFGVVAAGFLFMPRFGMYATVLLLSGVGVILGLALVVASGPSRRIALTYIAIPLVVVLLTTILLPSDLVRYRVLRLIKGEVLSYEEDYYGSVVLSRETHGKHVFKRLSVNGVSYSGTGPPAVRYMRLQGHLPTLIHPGTPERALVICFGVGLTAGAISTYPGIDLTVVELSRAVMNLSGQFREFNENVAEQPSTRVVVDDGRNFLLRHRDEQFDVVTLEPPPPAHAGIANLYSTEFYQLIRSRLTDDGVAAQWIPLETQSNSDTKMLMASFLEVFPNAVLWWTEVGETLIMGSKSDRDLPPGHLARAFRIPAAKRSLEQIGIHNEVELASNFLLDNKGLQQFLKGVPVMTDDLPKIEYQIPAMNSNYLPNVTEMLLYRPSVGKIARILGIEANDVMALRRALNSTHQKRVNRIRRGDDS